MHLSEPLAELFGRSRVVVLDLGRIPDGLPDAENIEAFFQATAEAGENPRLPQNRQSFNDGMLAATGARYLIGGYGEDRIAMLADTPAGRSGRTIHLALDIFARHLEPVLAPCDGEIVASDYEDGFGEYGNYLILKPSGEDYCLFFGHLSSDLIGMGPVARGQQLARLGDYVNNENGGWSRHLHLQVLTELPPPGRTPDGYSSRTDLAVNSALYPDPLLYFPEWRLR